MAGRRDDLVDETVLRRSLRLEPDEPTPRFDAAAIASLARPRVVPAVVLGGVVFATAIALTASMLWSLATAVAPDVAGAVIALVLDGVARVASLVYPLLRAATEPAIPLSLITATGVAIFHEMRAKKEHVHVHAS